MTGQIKMREAGKGKLKETTYVFVSFEHLVRKFARMR